MKLENIEIEIWDDAECRDDGINYFLSTDDIGCEKIEDVVHCIQHWYDHQLESSGGCIEVNEIDDEGEWLKTIYHISEDSDDIIKNVVGWERE